MTVAAANRPGSESAARADVDVLVVGAGPTGLTAACEALRHGLSVRIIERNATRSTFSRALVAHARTLEVFDTMGVVDAILGEGTRFAALNTYAGRRRRRVRVDLLDLPWGDTAYPYWLSIPQYATERVLETHLNRLGGEVEWRTTFDDKLVDHGDHVEAVLQRPDGGHETVRARWLIGCDGGRSRVREHAGLRLDRSADGATFVLADTRTTARLTEDEGHVYLAPEGLLLIVPMPEPTRWRIIAHVPTPPPDTALRTDAAFLDELIRRRAGIDFGSHDLTWTSQFNLSHGLADRYRRGRVFIAGDAAHVHSPVGGQGLNTGVQDAHNLLWKLAAARRMGDDAAVDRLLRSYEAERRPIAQAMVHATARVTRLLTAGAAARRILGVVAPLILARPTVQLRFGRGVGMLENAYPRGPLVAAAPPGGRRMPNPVLRHGGRLYERLDPLGHTLVVRRRLGEPHPDPDDPIPDGVPHVVLPDDALGEPVRDLPRVTLVRPDRYVAAAGGSVDEVWPRARRQKGSMPIPRTKGQRR
ncbi:MAG TPA: FAD-dependent monooxygenase [Jiangellales bacterium]|nr:FAD-dependent monooxygenase [Jiangellales bacterium]